MEHREFHLTQDYIELNKLLKLESLVNSGAQAGLVISEQLVQVNNDVEIRKRRKLRRGDVVLFENTSITLI